jgi:hypothetical protein
MKKIIINFFFSLLLIHTVFAFDLSIGWNFIDKDTIKDEIQEMKENEEISEIWMIENTEHTEHQWCTVKNEHTNIGINKCDISNLDTYQDKIWVMWRGNSFVFTIQTINKPLFTIESASTEIPSYYIANNNSFKIKAKVSGEEDKPVTAELSVNSSE